MSVGHWEKRTKVFMVLKRGFAGPFALAEAARITG